jgi:hypothetical protein
VYDPKSVDLVIPGFFLYHDIYYHFPASVREPVIDGVVDEGDMSRYDLFALGFKDCAFFGCKRYTMMSDKSLVVAKVNSRR